MTNTQNLIPKISVSIFITSVHPTEDLFPTRRDENPGFILQDIKGMIVFMEKLTANLFVANG